MCQLSGGELQKVSIAAAYMKDADIYYFDEVTNYLDIEERLRVAVILKELAESKNVMMAEHDLTILDYVSSYVHVVYGDENVYGMVSGVKNVRGGHQRIHLRLPEGRERALQVTTRSPSASTAKAR